MVRINKGKWTLEEHEAFLLGVKLFGRQWEALIAVVPTRSALQIRTHAQKYFLKIDAGLPFPDKPYPSQYHDAAGKSGLSAGAYMYGGVPQQHQHQDKLQQQQDELQQKQDEPQQQQQPTVVGLDTFRYTPELLSPSVVDLHVPQDPPRKKLRMATAEKQNVQLYADDQREYEELQAFAKWMTTF